MYQHLTSWENLLRAYKKAGKGKRSHIEVADFEYCLEENLICLQEELRSQAYRPGKYYSFYIHEPKRRRLKRRKGIHFRRKLKRLIARYREGDIPLLEIKQSVQGWINHTRYGNTVGLRKSVLGELRF